MRSTHRFEACCLCVKVPGKTRKAGIQSQTEKEYFTAETPTCARNATTGFFSLLSKAFFNFNLNLPACYTFMAPKQPSMYNEFAIFYCFMQLHIVPIWYLMSGEAGIDRKGLAELKQTARCVVSQCLFSNHNLIHLLRWNGVVWCEAIFLFSFVAPCRTITWWKFWAPISGSKLFKSCSWWKKPIIPLLGFTSIF